MQNRIPPVWKKAIVEHLIAVNHKPAFSHPTVPMSRGEKLAFFLMFATSAAMYWALAQ